MAEGTAETVETEDANEGYGSSGYRAYVLFALIVVYTFNFIDRQIIGILAIEAGLLTPPFGLLVYTVKAAIEDPKVGVQEIFLSSIPYWGIMLFAAVLLKLSGNSVQRRPNTLTFRSS